MSDKDNQIKYINKDIKINCVTRTIRICLKNKLYKKFLNLQQTEFLLNYCFSIICDFCATNALVNATQFVQWNEKEWIFKAIKKSKITTKFSA